MANSGARPWDIGEWLQGLGLGQYEAAFHQNEVNESVLPKLTQDDLKEIGVGPVGHRRMILDAIETLRAGTDAKAPPPEAPSTVPDRAKDTAERRQVTVMFSDLVGSTALSARMDPEDLRELISAYQKCVSDTVQRFGGFVAKYMGDGVLVYFGYPQAHEDDAERAVRAGLELIEKVGGLKMSAPLQTRVGIATGLVVVGDLVGTGEAQERGIVGETPNLAARLQGIAEPNMVVIAESTRKLIGDLFELQDLGAKHLKGIAEPAKAWTAMRPSLVESRFEALHTATTPLVGREEEIELLMRRWAQAKAGEGCVALISGEPGIGKSRLAETLHERLSTEPHTRVRFFCSPHHQDSALYPAIVQLERAAGFHREDTVEQRLARLEALLAQATNDVSGVAPLFADLLSIPTGERYPALALTPQKRKEKTLQALVAQVERLALRQPLMMTFEDVHWSDPTTRELLDLVIERVPTIKLLVLITYRPEFSPAWIGLPQVTLMTLNRLPPRQRLEMISHMTGGKALPREITNQIVERTDGIPLFIEELMKAVIETGVVVDAGDRYAAADATPSLAIPRSLHASLLARLDRLAPTREVAQIGAALGRSFSHELISAVADMPDQVLDDALEQLVRAELVFRRGTPHDAEYTFKHALVRDAAYDTLLRSNRIGLHAHIASVLERDFRETITASPEILAQHYTSAGIAEKAIPYWLKAGHVALQKSHLAEATTNLRKGLKLISGLADENARAELELELQAALAITLSGSMGLGRPEVEQAYLRARELCDEIGSGPQLFPVLYGLFVFHWSRANIKEALTNAEEMLRIAMEAGNPAWMLIGHFSVGSVLWCVGPTAPALDHLLRAQAIYDEKVHAPIAYVYGEDFGVWTLGILATVQLSAGYPDRASGNLREAIALARRLNHTLSVCNALLFNSLNSYYLRDWMPARAFIEEAHGLAVEYGFAQYFASTTSLRAHILGRLGSVKEGIDLAREGVAAWKAVGAAITLPFGLTALAESLLAAGQMTEALDETDQALFWIDKSGERVSESYVHCCRGDIFRAMSEPERAGAEYQTALEVAIGQQAKFFELKAAMSMARLWRDQGKRDEARELLAPVYGWFTEGFDTRDLKEAKVLLDELAA